MRGQEPTQGELLEMCNALEQRSPWCPTIRTVTKKDGGRGCQTETGPPQSDCGESQSDPGADNGGSGDFVGDTPLFWCPPKEPAAFDRESPGSSTFKNKNGEIRGDTYYGEAYAYVQGPHTRESEEARICHKEEVGTLERCACA